MRTTHVAVAGALLVILLTISSSASAQSYEGSGVFGGGAGSNPLGNITLDTGGAVGPAVGTYVTSVDNSDASYTLHFITTDAAGNVVSHTTETYNADGTVTTGTVPGSTGEALGDIMGGVTDSSFYSDPMGCLSFYCDGGSGDPFSDPYSLLSTSFGSNGW